MNPARVERSKVQKLEDLPNIGKAMATDLRLIGIHSPEQLKGCNGYELYSALCRKTGVRHDPCVIDVLLSITDFMNGGKPQPWWSYTEERKRWQKQNP